MVAVAVAEVAGFTVETASSGTGNWGFYYSIRDGDFCYEVAPTRNIVTRVGS
jgi:hypothetical protein